MAARRLLLVMLVLLGVSTLAALMAPSRPLQDAGTTSTATTETTTEATETIPEDTVPRGKRLGIAIDVSDGKVRVVPIQAGDQLALTISSEKPAQLEIPAFGLLETVGPGLPARFDLLAERAGSFGVKTVDGGRVVARIEVSPAPKPKEERKSRAEGGPDAGGASGKPAG